MNKSQKTILTGLFFMVLILAATLFLDVGLTDDGAGNSRDKVASGHKFATAIKETQNPSNESVINGNPGGDIDEYIDTVLSKMSDEEKVGQLISVGIDGPEIDRNALMLIRKYHVGGITLFDRNMVSPSQTAHLVNQLQRESLGQNAKLPLFISIDQEGGAVMRMSEKTSAMPAQEDLARSGEPRQAGVWAERNSDELKAMGINVNFAPVVDLGATYKRSYGTDPLTVENFAREAVKGYQKKALISCLKHFPGIGRAKVDPHENTDTIDVSRKVLEETDLLPFRNLIRELDSQWFFVMVSHLKYPAYDSALPASLSEIIMKDLLRGQLGFKGIIVTDDMEMGALTKWYSFERMGPMAINAGADLVLVCHNLSHQIAVYEGLLAAVKNGSISRQTLDDRVRRLIKTKITKIPHTAVDAVAADKIVGKN